MAPKDLWQGAATGYGGFPEHPELRISNLKQVR
jgi:hypothetical protein